MEQLSKDTNIGEFAAQHLLYAAVGFAQIEDYDPALGWQIPTKSGSLSCATRNALRPRPKEATNEPLHRS